MVEKVVVMTPEKRAEIMASMDWDKIHSQTDGEIEAQNAADPDASPLTDRQGFAVSVQRIRKSSGLSQPAFAERFRIPVATLRDWEQGRREPDTAIVAYLRVIERNPEAVVDALVDAAE